MLKYIIIKLKEDLEPLRVTNMEKMNGLMKYNLLAKY